MNVNNKGFLVILAHSNDGRNSNVVIKNYILEK